MDTRSIAAAIVLLIAAAPTDACDHDLECGTGSRCLKSSGSLQGRCVPDVLTPGPSDPATPPAGAATQTARRCTFDSDCGEQRACLRTSGQSAGLCVKR